MASPAQQMIEANRALTSQTSIPSSYSTFPSTLPNKFIRLSFFKYNRPATSGASSNEQIQATINMPLPISLLDQYVARFTGVDLGILGGLLMDAGSATKEIFSDFSIDKVSSKVQEMYKSLTPSVANDIATLLLVRFAGYTAGVAGSLGLGGGGIQTATEQLLGRIVNPRTVSAFHGMNLRTHNFQWFLAPKNEAESRSLENIFSIIRFHMHPPKGATEYVIEYPSEVEIDVIGVEQHLFYFKRCVITGFSVDRTASGQPAFFKDSQMPVMYRCSLSLSEVETILRDDLPNTSNGLQGNDNTATENRR